MALVKPIPMTYDPKTGIRKTGQEVVFQLDQSGVAARPCDEITKSRNLSETYSTSQKKKSLFEFLIIPPRSFPVFRVFQKFAT